MRTVIMADPHIGKFWKQNNAAYNRAQKLFDYTISALNNEANKTTNLILAGDIYDSVHANIEMLVKFKKTLDDALSNYKDVNIIAGNHETFIDKQGKQQTLLEIGIDNNNNNIMVDGVHSTIIDDINYIFVPYQHNILDIFMEEVPKFLSKTCINIIIAHETPKEIFSYSKLEMNPILDHYYELGFNNIPFVLLGHYHKPKKYTYKNTIVLSIGCLYYDTVDDVRDVFRDDLQKRYLIIDHNSNEKIDDGNILYTFGDYVMISRLYSLPRVTKLEVKSQADYEKKINKIIKEYSITPKNDIILLSSKVLIDYSQAMFEGYDIYFDLIEDTNEQLLALNESNAQDVIDQITTGKTLDDRWKIYLSTLELTKEQKNLATYLFEKRNDLNIDSNKLFEQLSNTKKKRSTKNAEPEQPKSLKDIQHFIDQF